MPNMVTNISPSPTAARAFVSFNVPTYIRLIVFYEKPIKAPSDAGIAVNKRGPNTLGAAIGVFSYNSF